MMLNVGIFIEGVEKLGMEYEGIWRVVKYLLRASSGQSTRFTLFHHVRFAREVKQFLGSLQLKENTVTALPLGQAGGYVKGEEIALAREIEGLALPIDIWLVPNLAWKAVQHVSGPKVALFHDFVMADYRRGYPLSMWSDFGKTVRDSLRYIDKYVCTTPYVYRTQALGHCGIPAERVVCIPHAPLDYSHYLKTFKVTEEGVELTPNQVSAALRQVIKDFLGRHLHQWMPHSDRQIFLHHTINYPFHHKDYIFVSTQDRPHKNLLQVAETLSYLNRKLYSNRAVMTTALINSQGKSPTERFLVRNKLFGDMMTVGKLDERTHAAMYYLASVTVHPSAFEGAFPLPFCESVSVGTPCLLPFSKSYVDMVPRHLWDRVFYEPSTIGLAEKLQDIKVRPDWYLAGQNELLSVFSQRAWSDVFATYREIFQSVVDRRARKNDHESAHSWFHFRYPQQASYQPVNTKRQSSEAQFVYFLSETEAESALAPLLIEVGGAVTGFSWQSTSIIYDPGNDVWTCPDFSLDATLGEFLREITATLGSHRKDRVILSWCLLPDEARTSARDTAVLVPAAITEAVKVYPPAFREESAMRGDGEHRDNARTKVASL